MNLILRMDWECLKDGNYQNVVSGQQFYDGSDMSRLLADVSPQILAEAGGLLEGQVWQSPFKNWVYESGLTQLNASPVLQTFPLPILVSGVYVDGRFCPTSPLASGYDPSCAHTVDYINGRVIFNNALPIGTNVHATFSYKEVKVTTANQFNNQLVNGVLETKFTTNPRTSSQLIYPSGTTRIQPYPIIFIEDTGRTWDAYQLGDRSLVANDEILFHIYALDEATCDNLIDLISFEERKPVLLIDFNFAPLPLSGLYNTLSPDYIPYLQLVGNPTLDTAGHTAVRYHGWIENVRVLDTDSLKSENQSEVIQRALVSAVVKIYTINPTTSIGFNPNPVFPGGNTNG